MGRTKSSKVLLMTKLLTKKETKMDKETMKKPEKKKYIEKYNSENRCDDMYVDGWNDHYDAVEKWLPSEEEIVVLLQNKMWTVAIYGDEREMLARKLAKAISKRLRGEK